MKEKILTFAKLWLEKYEEANITAEDFCPDLNRLGFPYTNSGSTCRNFCPLSSCRLDKCGDVEAMREFIRINEKIQLEFEFEF